MHPLNDEKKIQLYVVKWERILNADSNKPVWILLFHPVKSQSGLFSSWKHNKMFLGPSIDKENI